MTRCPRCRTQLDEGPIVYRCSTCRRSVPAADLDVEFRGRPVSPRRDVLAGAS